MDGANHSNLHHWDLEPGGNVPGQPCLFNKTPWQGAHLEYARKAVAQDVIVQPLRLASLWAFH